MNNVRSRNWCFTGFVKPEPTLDKVQYMVYQKELCPTTKREHWQGYAEFDSKQSMRGVKLIFNDQKLHLEKRKGSQEQAREYCMKIDTRIEEPYEYGEMKDQGHRSDLDQIWEDVNNGDTMKEILNNHKGNALRCIHAIEKAVKIRWDLSALDGYIKLQRKEKKDPLDEKIDDELFKKLYS